MALGSSGGQRLHARKFLVGCGFHRLGRRLPSACAGIRLVADGTAGAIGGVPRFGDTYDRTVWFVGAGARLQVWKGFFASFEVGAISRQTPAFSSTYQFATSFGWSRDRFLISVRHISNAGLKEPNFGETTFLAGVSF